MLYQNIKIIEPIDDQIVNLYPLYVFPQKVLTAGSADPEFNLDKDFDVNLFIN